MKKRDTNKLAMGLMGGSAGYTIVGTILLRETLEQNVAAVIVFMIATVVAVLTKD